METFQSPLNEYHVSQGATLAEYHGAMVPVRFTDPAVENRVVRTASGLFDFSFRAKFRMKGRDHAKLLQRLVSNDVKTLTPGQGTYATLLNAQGHVVVDLRLYCAEEGFLVDTEADLREKAIQSFRRYIIADQVEIEPLELYALAFQGVRARGLLEKTLHIDLPAMQEFDHFVSNYAGFPIRVVHASSTGEEGYEVWMNAAGMEAVWGAACGQAPTYGMLPCGWEALESYIQRLDRLGGVSGAKECWRGASSFCPPRFYPPPQGKRPRSIARRGGPQDRRPAGCLKCCAKPSHDLLRSGATAP